jgi:hypothetical protein
VICKTGVQSGPFVCARRLSGFTIGIYAVVIGHREIKLAATWSCGEPVECLESDFSGEASTQKGPERDACVLDPPKSQSVPLCGKTGKKKDNLL